MFNRNSLRFRLIFAALIVLLLALQVAGVALYIVFERSLYRQADLDLEADLDQITALLTPIPHGPPVLAGDLSDPRFARPLSGRYWQVLADGRRVLASRSLWDSELTLPVNLSSAGSYQSVALAGPSDQRLHGIVRTVDFGKDAAQPEGGRYQIIVATDRAELDTLTREFRADLIWSLGGLGTLMVLASWLQVSIGLSPLEKLRQGLSKVRSGEEQRLSTSQPAEVRPLIDELNRLLERQEQALRRARARAGDLAHGLKTPLTAMAMQLESARDGHIVETEQIQRQLASMREHVERELSRARIAANAQIAHSADLDEVLSKLVNTMQHMPRGDEIAWRIDCPKLLLIGVEKTDLTELLGNIIDNARKWAVSSVTLVARAGDEIAEIDVTDDGPGVPASERDLVLKRGSRLDESVPGTGLGLAISKEMVEAYGGLLSLHSGAAGGLCVRIALPVAQAMTALARAAE